MPDDREQVAVKMIVSDEVFSSVGADIVAVVSLCCKEVCKRAVRDLIGQE